MVAKALRWRPGLVCDPSDASQRLTEGLTSPSTAASPVKRRAPGVGIGRCLLGRSNQWNQVTCEASSNALVTSSDALVTSSFLFLVVMPGATSSVPAPSSDAPCY